MNIKNILYKTFIRILYLTPIGYTLDFIALFFLRRKKDLVPNFFNRSYSPIIINIIGNIKTEVPVYPKTIDRINWFINGVFLLAETYLIWGNIIVITFGFNFFLISLILTFGLLNFFSAFFPHISWNKPLPRIIPIILLIAPFLLILLWAFWSVLASWVVF